MNKYKDKYDIVAGAYPSRITFIVLLIIGAICCVNHWDYIFSKASSVVVGLRKYLSFIDTDIIRIILSNASLASGVGLVLYAFFQLLTLLVREAGIIFPEGLIWSWFGAPTTRLLCKDNSCFTDEYKNRIFAKILLRYKVDLIKIRNRTVSNKKFVKEVCGVIAQTREDTRDNKVLLDFNMKYGFWRNLAGGLSFSILVTAFLLAIGFFIDVKFLMRYQVIIICVILIVGDLLCAWASDRNGIRYATQLYTLLLGLSDQR